MYTRILRGNKINMKGSPMAQLAKTPLAMQQTTCNAGDAGLIPELERCPEEGNGSSLQYSCLGNPMDGGHWWAMVRGVAKSWT